MQQGTLDTIHKQVIPVLTYWNSMFDINCAKLVVKPTLISSWIHHKRRIIPFPVDFWDNKLQVESKPLLGGNTFVNSNTKTLYLIKLISMYNFQLQKVVMTELECLSELKKGVNIPRVLEKMTQLIKNIDICIMFVDKILAHFIMKQLGLSEMPGCPSLQDLQESKKKMQQIKKLLKKDELHELLKNYSIDISQEVIVGTILGLKEECGHLLFSMNTNLRSSEPEDILYYCKVFLEDREAQLRADGELNDDFINADGLVNALVKIGFIKDNAKEIAENIPESVIPLQLPSFWAMRYVEHVLGHHPLLLNIPRYPCKESTINKWFQQDIGRSGESTSDADEQDRKGKCSMINVDRTGDGHTLVTDFLREMESEEFKILYHGTSHNYAMNILEKGIDVRLGRSKQDFSDGMGFYLSEVYETAEDWCKRRFSKQGAIIVFRIQVSKMDADKENGLDLCDTHRKKEWENIVRFNRSNVRDASMKKYLKQFTFIRGPICTPLEGLPRHVLGFGKGAIQMCIRNQDYADDFGLLENICCAIFL